MTIELSILFWVLAAICNSIIDTCNHHFSISKFSNFKKDSFWYNWFDSKNSWKLKYTSINPLIRKKIFWKINYPLFLTDSFHFFKSLMVVCLVLSIVTFNGALNWYSVVLFIVYGIIWNLTFSIFYDKILIK